MSRKPAGKSVPNKTATASSPEGELLRHLKDLGLESPEAYRIWCREQGFSTALHKGWQERRLERTQAAKLQAESKAREHLLTTHVRQLGLDDWAAYEAWCRMHSLNATLHKSAEQKRQELRLAQSERAEAALVHSRRFDRHPQEILRSLAKGTALPEGLKSPHIQKIAATFHPLGKTSSVRKTFLRLLLRVQETSDLLRCDPVIGYLGPQQGNTYIEALMELARRHRGWLRQPETWKPDSRSPGRQFASLARHLLAHYEVPSFLDAAWFEGNTERAVSHQEWFCHIGIGQNIRTAQLPLHLTKRAAHLLLQAPRELPIEAALRWCQVRALGGDEYLTRAVLATRLAEIQQDEPFWISVLHFLLNNPMLDFAQFGPILDYIHHQRFVPAEVFDECGHRVGMAIPEPNFSMKGRTGTALLRRVEEWHRQLSRDLKRPNQVWNSSGIGSLALEQREEATGQEFLWTIEELTTSQALLEEGKAMRHCVASYVSTCAKGISSIWSMQMEERKSGIRRRVMTIEVNNAHRAVCQARGRCNKAPGDKRAGTRLAMAPDILKRWAEQQGLSIPSHVC